MGSEIEGILGRLRVGDRYPVRVIGAINVSPESFYKGSIRVGYEEIAEAAKRMVDEGADIIDVGGMSTAPYLKTWIEEEEEERRIKLAVEAVRGAVNSPISVDTSRYRPAKAAIDLGAEIVNDVRGLKNEPRLAELVAEHDLSLIVCASGIGRLREASEAPRAALKALKESIEIALRAGVDEQKIVIDPAIGFHRSTGLSWHLVDCSLLRGLRVLRELGRPISVGISRKSFLGEITGRKDPEERLPASIAAEALAVIFGAHLIRTHDVAEAVDAIRVAEAVTGRRI